MIGRLKDFFLDREARAQPGAGRHSVEEFELAAAALLVYAAGVDDDYAAAERRLIREILGARFSLSDEEAGALLDSAEHRVNDSVQILGFTRSVKDNFSYEERVELVEMLWEVVLSDGRLDDHEAQLMRRIGGLIYVSDRDRGHARQRAAARLSRS